MWHDSLIPRTTLACCYVNYSIVIRFWQTDHSVWQGHWPLMSSGALVISLGVSVLLVTVGHDFAAFEYRAGHRMRPDRPDTMLQRLSSHRVWQIVHLTSRPSDMFVKPTGKPVLLFVIWALCDSVSNSAWCRIFEAIGYEEMDLEPWFVIRETIAVGLCSLAISLIFTAVAGCWLLFAEAVTQVNTVPREAHSRNTWASFTFNFE